jgi:hypothetical protein
VKKLIIGTFIGAMLILAIKAYSNYQSYPHIHKAIYKVKQRDHTGRMPARHDNANEYYCKYPGPKGMERPPTSGVGGSRYDLYECCEDHEGMDCYYKDGKHYTPYKMHKTRKSKHHTGPKYVDMEITQI